MNKPLSLSIGILTKNRKNKFLTCILSLKKQRQYIDEIIVLEDREIHIPRYCSSSLLRKFFPKSTVNYEYVSFSNIAKSRNEIKKRCTKDILLFIDDDVIVNHNSLTHVVNLFKKHKKIGVLTGRMLPVRKNDVSQIDALYFNQERWEKSGLQEIDLCAFSFIAIRNTEKELQAITFSENLLVGEDIDFIIKAKELGIKTFFSGDIVNYHYFDETITQFINKKYSHGKYFFLLKKLHSENYYCNYSENPFNWIPISLGTLRWYTFLNKKLNHKQRILVIVSEIASLFAFSKHSLLNRLFKNYGFEVKE